MNRTINIKMKDRRLIDALEYIDDEYIASAALLKMRADAEKHATLAQTAGQSIKKHWKHYLGFVACLLVLALIAPLFSYLPEIIYSFAAGWAEGSETLEGDETSDNSFTTEINEKTYPPKSDDVNENLIIPNYWAFVPDLEPISEELMLEIREAWTEYQYNTVYDSRYAAYIYYNYFDSDEEARKKAQQAADIAKQNAQYDWFTLHIPEDGNLPNAYSYRYYGIIADYVVLIVYEAGLGPYANVQIGDSSFEFPYGGNMYLYKSGEFFNMRSIFNEGLISNEQVAIIADRHKKYEAGYTEWFLNELKKMNKE